MSQQRTPNAPTEGSHNLPPPITQEVAREYSIEMQGEPIVLKASTPEEMSRKISEFLLMQMGKAASPWAPAERRLVEIIADLSRRIPDRHLQSKTKGGQQLTFFTWVTAQRYLDWYAPGWHGRATLTYSGERVGCVYDICIPTSDAGLVCRSASGDDQEDDEDMDEREQRQRQYGTPTTRAEGQAFKRAAGRFGFGLYLRDKK